YSGIEIVDTFLVYVDCNYVILVWQHDEADIYEVLEDQLNTLKYLTLWNPRGRFIVVLPDHVDQSSQTSYEKNLETFEELLHSNLKYGYIDTLELAIDTGDYREHKRFPPSRKVDCSDFANCMKRVILERDVATLTAPMAAQYTASTLGLNYGSKDLCFLEERLAFVGNIALLPKGSALLPRLNIYIRRTLEGGLADKLWEETKHIARHTSEKRTGAHENKLYFVFSF
ncbi:hypothetical protein ANN_19789, partial [Periplaneta americana]